MNQCVTEIIAIGNEILADSRRDSNSDFIAQWAAENGLLVRYRSIVGDNVDQVSQTIKTAIQRANLVIITGGLGPTWDDVTRNALSIALKKKLVLDPGAEQSVVSSYTARGVVPDEKEKQQAVIPAGSKWLKNCVGLAPGILFQGGGYSILALPGVPPEMKSMLENINVENVVPSSCIRSRKITRKINIIGKREHEIQKILANILDHPGITFSILPGHRWIELGITGSETHAGTMNNEIDSLVNQVRELLGTDVFSTGNISLEESVAGLLVKTGKTISVAESCTGGLTCYRLTAIPGSSQYFRMGMVTYSNKSKETMLNIQLEILEKSGAVSYQVAEKMAKGIRRVSGTSIGISITGIAGPGGGTTVKPVGSVFFGMDTESGCTSTKYVFTGDRDRIRSKSADFAMDMVRRYLLNLNPELVDMY